MTPPPKRARRNGWSDLPDDLLGVILDRLPPAFGDRVRFRAVCQSWRSFERTHPRHPMPWLVAPGYCVSLDDGAIHRVPLPEDALAATCRGSFGDWLALVPPSGDPFLLNAFTFARIELPRWSESPVSKIVLSSAPDSTNCTVAAIVGDEDYDRKVIVCRLGRGCSWRSITKTCKLQDIIFFEGKLHGIDARQNPFVENTPLLRLINIPEDDEDELDKLHDEPSRSRPHPTALQPLGSSRLHLVAFHGSLHVVYRYFGSTGVFRRRHYTSGLDVFLSGHKTAGKPEPVVDFGGHAIFVGDACCGVFAVDAAAGGKIRESHICFVDDEKNMSSLAFAGGRRTADGPRNFRRLESYDVRYGCFRTYEPPEPSPGSTAGAWRCVTVQRLTRHSVTSPLPPPEVTLSGDERLLWELIRCLGAWSTPCYYYTLPPKGTGNVDDGHSATVLVGIPAVPRVMFRDHRWKFTQRGRSAMEAMQAAAHEAVTFLRSRFRGVLDDSPWSSIPHYHGSVDEKAEEER